MDTKTFRGVEIKNADQGMVTAVFSTFDVVDLDGDITVKGAIKDGTAVIISDWNHSSWQGASPIGKGVVRNVGNQAVVEAQFFMGTQKGRDAFEIVKQLGDRQEWSYGFDVVDSEPAPEDAKASGAKRILKQLNVHEVSPVMIGAGVGTRTLGVKAASHTRAECMDPKCEDHPTDDEDEIQRRRERRRRNRRDGDQDRRDDDGKGEGKRSFTAEQRRELADSGKAMPDGSFPIVNTEDLHNAIRLAGNADNPAVARRHIMRRARALGHEDMIPDDWKKARFADELKEVVASVSAVRRRAADVMAMRAQKGAGLGEESAVLVKQIHDELSKLDELLAEGRNDAQREWLRSIASNL